MKNTDLYIAMENIDEELIERSESCKDKGRIRTFMPVIGVAAAACMVWLSVFKGTILTDRGSEIDIKESGNAAELPDRGDVLDTDAAHAESKPSVRNFFTITAKAADIEDVNGENIVSGKVYGMSISSNSGSNNFLPSMFGIYGENIDKLYLSIDRQELYYRSTVAESENRKNLPKQDLPGIISDAGGDESYTYIRGERFSEGMDAPIYYLAYLERLGAECELEYNPEIKYGFYLPIEADMANKTSDLQEWVHRDIDEFDGAMLTIGATYTDGSYEEHQYLLKSGKIKTPIDENGRVIGDKLTEFVTADDEPYVYGILMMEVIE